MKYSISINKVQSLWKKYQKSSKIIKSLKRNRKKIKPAMHGIVEIFSFFIDSMRQQIKK